MELRIAHHHDGMIRIGERSMQSFGVSARVVLRNTDEK
jgi:hypothetical protein